MYFSQQQVCYHLQRCSFTLSFVGIGPDDVTPGLGVMERPVFNRTQPSRPAFCVENEETDSVWCQDSLNGSKVKMFDLWIKTMFDW